MTGWRRIETSRASLAATALPPVVFSAVVATAVPHFTAYAMLGGFVTLAFAFAVTRRRRAASTLSVTRAFGLSLLGVAVMFVVYTAIVMATLSRPIH